MTEHPVRTSLDSPLRIATLALFSGGCIGMTICPGKRAPTSIGGHAWERDLSVDLEAIRTWGADAVVTLMEDWELSQYGVSQLGRAAGNLEMRWLHLPIVDGDAPTASWDEAWSRTHGPVLHGLLDAGRSVLIHCLGGRGRTGTVAARLLIERGMAPDLAISRVREVREGAIETREQEVYLLAMRR